MRGQVIRAFVPEGDEAASLLPLVLGDILEILEQDESGWWAGHKEGDCTTGWFPGGAVAVLEAAPAPAAPSVASRMSNQSSIRASSVAGQHPRDCRASTTSLTSTAQSYAWDPRRSPTQAARSQTAGRTRAASPLREPVLRQRERPGAVRRESPTVARRDCQPTGGRAYAPPAFAPKARAAKSPIPSASRDRATRKSPTPLATRDGRKVASPAVTGASVGSPCAQQPPEARRVAQELIRAQVRGARPQARGALLEEVVRAQDLTCHLTKELEDERSRSQQLSEELKTLRYEWVMVAERQRKLETEMQNVLGLGEDSSRRQVTQVQSLVVRQAQLEQELRVLHEAGALGGAQGGAPAAQALDRLTREVRGMKREVEENGARLNSLETMQASASGASCGFLPSRIGSIGSVTTSNRDRGSVTTSTRDSTRGTPREEWADQCMEMGMDRILMHATPGQDNLDATDASLSAGPAKVRDIVAAFEKRTVILPKENNAPTPVGLR